MNDIKKAMMQNRRTKLSDDFVFNTINIIKEKECIAERKRSVYGYIIMSVIAFLMFAVSVLLFKNIISFVIESLSLLMNSVNIPPIYLLISIIFLILVFINYVVRNYKLHKNSI